MFRPDRFHRDDCSSQPVRGRGFPSHTALRKPVRSREEIAALEGTLSTAREVKA